MKNRMTRAHSVRKLLVEDEPAEKVDLDMNDSIDKADFEDAIDVPGSMNAIEDAVFVLEQDVTTKKPSNTLSTSAPDMNKSVPNEQDIHVNEPESEPFPVKAEEIEAKKGQTRVACTVCGKILNIKSLKKHKESMHDQKRGPNEIIDSQPKKKQKL
jgi:hypothetical protein